MHCCLVGRPGVLPGRKVSLPRPIDLATGESAVVKGVSKLLRSERGCPIVDISQLETSASLHNGCFLDLLQYSYNLWLCLVEDHVIDFVVAVNKGTAILRLGSFVAEEGDHVIEMRNLSHRLV